MLQNISKSLITNIVKTKVAPVWLMAAVVVTQIAINNLNQTQEPLCRIKLDDVHESKHSRLYLEQRDAKVKIMTECDAPQEITSLVVSFEEEMTDGTFKLAKTRSVDARPDPDTPNTVTIKDVTVPCSGKGSANYQARAEGQVRLKDGREETVSGKSPNLGSLKCRIRAK